jgi:predicted O-methyltransferase YrrM
MRLLLKIYRLARWPVGIVITALVIPAAYVMLAYRTIGSASLPRATRILKRLGVFPIRDHYYEPLFDDGKLKKSLREARALPGIDFRREEQLALLQSLGFEDEFRDFLEGEKQAGGEFRFTLENPNFRSGDAEFLFQYVRYLKPKKVIEIGSGSSTQVVSRALQLNAEFDAAAARHLCVEPYENPWLEQLGRIELLRQRVEDAAIDWGTDLGSGDLLFIDSSHMIRPQGDVLFEYLEILPQLRPGVVVHIHDIFSPRDYLDQWVRDQVRFWNEQYLLEATLGNSARYRIVAALNFLKHEHYAELQRVCPFLTPDREPGSLYFRVVN